MSDASALKARLEMGERIFASLREPFQAVDLEWRVMYTRSARNESEKPLILVTPYVNRPALINRLNQVCGLAGWQTDARVSGGHVYVGVAVLVRDEWVWRWDGTGLLDHDPKGKGLSIAEAGKGNFSNAFKRSCEQFGMALYLRELKPLRAIINGNGRYKVKIGDVEYRWDPPGIEGSPSYPGEIPGFDTPEGGAPDGNGQSEPENPPAAVAPKKPTPEEEKELIKAARVKLSSWMREKRYLIYHLEAVLATHKQLVVRYPTPEKLGELGTIDDWNILLATTERRAPRWNDAPKELAQEFPTTPERLQVLEQLMDQMKLDSQERIHIEEAKAIGWNDAIEYWIEELGKRT